MDCISLTIILFGQLHDPYAVGTLCRPCSEPAEVWMWMGQDSCHHRSQGGCLLGGDRTNKTGKNVQQILVSKYSKQTLWFSRPTKTRMPTRDMRIGPTIIAYDQMIGLRYCMEPKFYRVTIFVSSDVLRLAAEDYMLFRWNSCARCLTRTFGSI